MFFRRLRQGLGGKHVPVLAQSSIGRHVTLVDPTLGRAHADLEHLSDLVRLQELFGGASGHHVISPRERFERFHLTRLLTERTEGTSLFWDKSPEMPDFGGFRGIFDEDSNRHFERFGRFKIRRDERFGRAGEFGRGGALSGSL